MEIRRLGVTDYQQTWQAMRDFTVNRDANTQDELWITEHPSVYTLGLNGKREHLLEETQIPIIQSDRGGQITYHGLQQLVIYTLIDIKRQQINSRQLVDILEKAMIDTLVQYGLHAQAKADAPGIYINQKKIGSIGLRIKQGGSYHGLSLNNQLDLSPFNAINTCGYADLEVTNLVEQGIIISNQELAIPLVSSLYQQLNGGRSGFNRDSL